MASKNVEYNFLGNSGLKVSNLCLGTMTFGKCTEGTGDFMWFYSNPRQLDEAVSHKILDKYVDLGGNFIDTANIYGYGLSEKIIGNWMSSRNNRDDVVLATKARFPLNESVNGNGLSRRNLVAACEASLERLQTNYIDLYQCHFWDSATPVDETLRTLDDLTRCGKIRYYGYSNLGGWQMQKVVATAKEYGFSRCISLQQQYSLLKRHSELEPFHVCRSEGIGVMTWSPLSSGWLTGKIKQNQKPADTESRIGHFAVKGGAGNFWDDFSNDDTYWNLRDVMEKVAKTHDKSLAQVALRWLIQKDIVASVIIGVTSLAQLEDNMGASGGWSLTEEEMKQLDDASEIKSFYPYNVGGFNAQRYNRYNRESIPV